MPPAQTVAAGTALDKNPPLLFKPLQIRGSLFQNRVWVSPMCQYSAENGHLTEFHFSHLTAFILRGPSLTIIEATSVLPEGRITPHDSGLWERSQIEPITKITKFAHDRRQKVGIQLAHAGRKASVKAPWELRRGLQSEVADLSSGGWPDKVFGADVNSWGDGHAEPKAMSLLNIAEVVAAFKASALYAVEAGIDAIEIHAAHGYLLSSFLSATSNSRTDAYGGRLSNRMRLALEVVDAVRAVMPTSMPLSFRISATEWLRQDNVLAWDNDSTIELAKELYVRGVDVLTLSSGGNSSDQAVPKTPDYQTNLAREIRQRLRIMGCDIIIAAVGRISSPILANSLLSSNEPAGELIAVGRQFLKEPSWVLRAANELGVRVQWPVQYQLGRYGLEAKL